MTAEKRATFVMIVHTFVYDEEGRLLLLRRANTGVMDGYYTLPGGHRALRETVADAAARECQEEVCLKVQALRPVVVLPYADGANFVFQAVAWSGAPAIGEPDKCDAIEFVAPNRLPKPTAPFVQTALNCLAGGEWYREGPSRTPIVTGEVVNAVEASE